jgi:hypothetical protein
MSLLERLEQQKTARGSVEESQDSSKVGAARFDQYAELKDKVHKEIIDIINQEISDNPRSYG